MKNYFVVGDVHGELDKLTALLKEWHPEKEQLILLGDLLDRGLRSRQVIQLAMALKEEHGAIILKGNHEELFLHWLNKPENHFYYSQGGAATVDSFFDTRMTSIYHAAHLAERIKEEFPEIIAFLNDLPNYHDAHPFIMAHAGVDLDMLDWKETDDDDFRWIRHDFHYGDNKTGRTILFGHTPTRLLNEDGSSDIWVSPCGTKIGLDGGAAFGGVLHGLRITNGELTESVAAHKDGTLSRTPFTHNTTVNAT